MKTEQAKIDILFPPIMQGEELEAIIHRSDRHHYYGTIMKQYLKNKIDGWNIGDFFEKYDIQKIALYATTELAEMAIKDIMTHRSSLEVVAIGDKYAKEAIKSFCGCRIASATDLIRLYQQNEIEKIIVCSTFFMNEIFDELMAGGIPQNDIISISSILFSSGF